MVSTAGMNWSVYIIHCSDNSLYTGITTDVDARFSQHASGKGAKYFRGRKPEAVVYVEDGHDRSSASREEIRLKKLSAREKWQLIEQAQK